MTNVYDVHGEGNRVVPPPCVQQTVHRAWPDPNGTYTGYRDPRADAEEAEAEMESTSEDPSSDDDRSRGSIHDTDSADSDQSH